MNPFPIDLYTLPAIEFVAGSTLELSFSTYYEINNVPFNLVDHTANISIINYINKSGEPQITKTMEIRTPANIDDAFDGNNRVQNVLYVKLTPQETINLYPGKYIYQITIKYVGNGTVTVEPPRQGIMWVARNINPGFIEQS